jgi:uncharacterized protein (DUF1501 family)
MHPSLAKTKQRFDNGRVAVVRGVGYNPPDLSHFESTDIWKHGWGGSGTRTTGWVGRFLDGLPNTEHESLYAVSLHGNVNTHLRGQVAKPSSLPLNIDDAFGIDRSDRSDARLYDAVESFGVGTSGLGPLGDFYDNSAMELMQMTQRIRPAYAFSSQPTNIQQQLVLAAHLINANLGIRVIDTALGGFDTHSEQADWHATLLARLDNAIDGFFDALSSRWRGQVVVMTFSEFGRRPEENGDAGTDHGAAGPMLLIGDRVRGGLHGTQPSLNDLDNNDDLRTHVDFRAVYATVLDTWLKADDREVLGRNYTPLSLFAAGPSAPSTKTSSPATAGYWLAGPSGTVRGFGSATKFGSVRVAHPIVAGAGTPTHKGLWLCGSDGGVFGKGDARYYGSMGGRHLNKPIVAMAATPSGRGYWLCASDGGMFCFGDAKFYGSTGGMRLNKPIVGMTRTGTGRGYWLVASDGGIFCFGDAKFRGSTGGRVSHPIVAMAATKTGKGYWLCASDGGVFCYGDAKFHGSRLPGSPVCSFTRTASGKGYWMVARDGRVGAFGDAKVLGRLTSPAAVIVRA